LVPIVCAFPPPLHIVTSALQFSLANAGIDALKLVAVAIVMIAAVVITITKRLVLAFRIMCRIMMVIFIHIFTEDSHYVPEGKR
jgi:hypothetical protein